ncbi:DNA-repair protein XRCC1 [Benincasa hispida]|uniref:DNA-repair protein XRCC1 n=1 Tax=Benincasa hispida TaxID=102211 RepID=UPI00190087E6|nr:DNA-repair protein XRCC1 [Benincasa hispida]XP_038899734.1 DNA-repair protein XRCC1 [Benincasa hispida]XP_038899736.1 DNA-repair protein XRCC1 [Benincasa hispida]
MSDSKTNEGGGNAKRSLPSWMSGKDDGSSSRGKKPNSSGSVGNDVEAKEPKQEKGNGEGPVSSSLHRDFSRLLEGVVFVLSGFVNPERSILRSQALEMGAQYKPDWNSDCTLLICAFPNTPKFRQVESDCGTIVSKEWISECYAQKRLVDIESYLLYAGKPWRRSNLAREANQAVPSSSKKPQKPVEKASRLKPHEQEIAQSREINSSRECFSPLKLKKWAIDDYHKTLSWLESQEEKPDPCEIKKIAAEGILTCLQDAIDSLHQNQDINQMTEEWKFVPQVVEELAKLGNKKESISKEELCRHASDSKRIYEIELNSLLDSSTERKKKPNVNKEPKNGRKPKEYDSDDTIEMTEDEIDIAFQKVACKKS